MGTSYAEVSPKGALAEDHKLGFRAKLQPAFIQGERWADVMLRYLRYQEQIFVNTEVRR